MWSARRALGVLQGDSKTVVMFRLSFWWSALFSSDSGGAGKVGWMVDDEAVKRLHKY